MTLYRETIDCPLCHRGTVEVEYAAPDPDDPQRIRATYELVFLTGWAPVAASGFLAYMLGLLNNRFLRSDDDSGAAAAKPKPDYKLSLQVRLLNQACESK